MEVLREMKKAAGILRFHHLIEVLHMNSILTIDV